MSCLPAVFPLLASSCVPNPISHASRDRNDVRGRSSQRARRLRTALAAGVVLLAALTGLAQVPFGSVAIATSATQTVSIAVPNNATVSSVQVLTLGVQGLDFQSAGAFSCTAQACTQPVAFSPLNPGLRVGAVVALDSTGIVLGTTYISGTGAGGLGVLLPGTIKTVAGDGDWKSEGDDEGATYSELFLPTAVALDGGGNIYIADSNHHRIRIVCAAAGPAFPGINCRKPGYIYTVAGTSGNSGYSGDGQVSISSSVTMNTPSGLAIDGAGNLYIADTDNHVIRRISAATGIISTIAGTGVPGFSGDGAAATTAQLYAPTGVAIDLAGNIFIADSGNDRIRAICAASSPLFGVACSARNIVTVAGSGAASPLGDGAAATAAALNAPYTITFDPAGNLYIADSDNNRVRIVCAASAPVLGLSCPGAGIIKTLAGTGTNAFKGDNGPAINAELFSPSGVVVDPAGNLYIADTQNFHIRKVNTGGVITSVAGTGAGSFGGDNGPATSAGIYGPYGLALDGAGNVYIASYLDNRVREIQANLAVASYNAGTVRQGSSSPTMPITVENDGTGVLDLTRIFVDPSQGNAQIDPSVTTCSTGASLDLEKQCVIGAIFAPNSTPALTANKGESGYIDVPDETVPGTAGSDSPLVIRVSGTASPVNSTTVILASSPNPSTFAQSVTFTATVQTGANTGALTGTVNFYNGATKVTSGVTVNASGIATFTTTSLPVGADSITAAYNEDGKDLLHFGSTSDPLVQVVNTPTSVNLASKPNPSSVGQAVNFTATVSATAGSTVTPTGTVDLVDGSNPVATATLSAGVATFSVSTLADGQHQMTAVYSGDKTNYIFGSTSAVLKQDVIAPSTVTLTASSPTSVYGTPVTFTATVAGSQTVTPSGSVEFFDGATKLGSATLSSGAVATITLSSLATGAHSITAAYSGDLNSAPGTSFPLTFTVSQTPSTTTLVATPVPGIAGKAVTLVATVKLSSGTGATGTVTFVDGSTSLGIANLGSDGTASIAPVLKPGPHAIVASYSGDLNVAASSSAALPFDVNLAKTGVNVTSSGSPAVVLSSITFAALVTGNGTTPTGSVVFTLDGATANTATLDSTGNASFSSSSLTVGNHVITAAYSGDSNNNASTSSQFTQAVAAITTATSLGTASTGGSNPETVLVATVVAPSGPTPTGTINFMNGATMIGTAALDANGVATLLPDLAPAAYNITAQYSGDSIHSASTSSAVKVSGTPTGFGMTVSPTTVTLASAANTTLAITFKSNNGYADTLGLGCGTLPMGVNCHFDADTVNLKAGATASINLTIDTNVPLGGGPAAMNADPRTGGFSLAGLFLPAGLLMGWIGWRFRKRNAAVFAALLVLALAGAATISGCGGFTQKSAAPGTYTIQVTAVGVGSNIAHYQNITLTITK